MQEKRKRMKPPGSGRKKLAGKGVTRANVSLLDEQHEFLMNLNPDNNVSEGVRMLCDRAMRSYPDNLRYPEQVVVALEAAIAAIKKKDLDKLTQLQPILEQCLEEINALSSETMLNEMLSDGLIKTSTGDWIA